MIYYSNLYTKYRQGTKEKERKKEKKWEQTN